jgi:sulfate adenylyltransferase subunit 1
MKGDEVTALPSMKSSIIKDIRIYDEQKETASAKESVVITLENDIDISRGDMLVKSTDAYTQLTELKATICWMGESPGAEGKIYFLQHGPNRVKAKITTVAGVLDIHSLEKNTGKKIFKLNDIGDIFLTLANPIFADLYDCNPANGSFILIDEFSNNTVAVGFVR